jgi:hypothetical protein
VTDPLTSPFVLVGDPVAAACEGDFCAVPTVPSTAPVERERDPEPAHS